MLHSCKSGQTYLTTINCNRQHGGFYYAFRCWPTVELWWDTLFEPRKAQPPVEVYRHGVERLSRSFRLQMADNFKSQREVAMFRHNRLHCDKWWLQWLMLYWRSLANHPYRN